MKIVAISDIHNNKTLLKKLMYKSGDLLLVGGDLTNVGYECELSYVLDLINKSNFVDKVIVLGNHDSKNRYNSEGMDDEETYEYLKNKYKNIIFLNNEIVEVQGLKIYGTPYTGGLDMWGYQFNNFDRKTKTTPKDNVDIILSHCPPSHYDLSYLRNIGDVGSPDLREYLEWNKVKLLITGHLHELSGNRVIINDCLCINSSKKIEEIIL